MHRTQADARLDALLSEPGRRGLLRRELTGAGLPAGQADRALRKACMAGTIERVGHGIYAVGDARIAEIMPEVLPKLGYRILPTPPLRNYSIRRSGVTYRLDKPCRRLVMRRGVVATYENRKGGLIQPDWNRTMSQRRDLPMGFEIDLRRRSMEYCHSTARAEKDLIVDKALEAYDEYQDPEAGFALDGGTSLSKYRGLIARFSEDLDIRVLLPKDVLADAVAKRDAMHRVGERFREYMVDAMPFLTPTSKGRLQRDGTVHSLIFDYSTPNTHPDVMQGLKCELVAMPLKREPNVVWRRGIDRRVVAVSEIVAGKFTALASRLPERGDSYPDLVRHAHDISVVKDIVAESPEFMASALDRLGTDRVNATLVELAKPAWSRHYGSYMSRMGTKPNPPPWQENLPFTYPSWPTVLEQTMRLCQSLGVATERTGKHVVERAAAMRKRPPSGDERD